MSGAVSSRGHTHEPTVYLQPTELENRATRLFHASPERVFRFFTDPSTAPYVFATDPKKVKIERMEVRAGGRYSISVELPDRSTVRFTGEYREVEPPSRVVNTFEVDSIPGVVALETDLFEPIGESTRVTVTWKYERPEDRDRMGGPEEVGPALREMWDNVAEILAKGEA